MKKELEKKVDYIYSVIATRFEKDYNINLNVEPTIDNRAFINLISALKTWLSDNSIIKERWDETTKDLVKSYFINTAEEFAISLDSHIDVKILATDALKVKNYINEIATAVAYQKFSIDCKRLLISSSPNN
ncbi:hypothetical protein [Pedobacter helvus]|uniref:Uncharacterized protein n=1 Tax=Pedobacter helvus TaxID=2563444 RepID=A0ABW9JMU5_9SPHI|nr:hypothetical protein [Pedobacter ureilyticus]